MAILTAFMVEQMKQSVPGFCPNPEDVDEELTYPIINDLGRFICMKAGESAWDEVKQALRFLEELLAMNDTDAQQLVGDCLSGLSECPSIMTIEPLFGKLLGQKARTSPL